MQGSEVKDGKAATDGPVEAPLTDRQLMFCHEYIVDLNGTRAAIRAGYTKNASAAAVEASSQLKDPRIQALIQSLMDGRAKRTEITSDYVLYSIKETIDRCLQREPVMEWCPIENSNMPAS
jgi:phage terminase small subunit